MEIKPVICEGSVNVTWNADLIPAQSVTATPLLVETVMLPTAQELSLKRIKLDDFMAGRIVRKFPFEVEIPEDYTLWEDPIDPTNVIWLPSEYFDAFVATEEVPSEAGFFRGRISMNIGYDAATDSFMCGIDVSCEESLVEQYESEGFTVTNFERHTIDGFPILIVEVDPPQGMFDRNVKIYMAYIGTLIATNTILINYLPADGVEAEGEVVWNRFKTTLLQPE
jgi:hypothetical protein